MVDSFFVRLERTKRPDSGVVQNRYFRFAPFYFLLFRSSVDFCRTIGFSALRALLHFYVEFCTPGRTGRQPRRTEKFSNGYQNGILFGTGSDHEGEMYANYFQWLETRMSTSFAGAIPGKNAGRFMA